MASDETKGKPETTDDFFALFNIKSVIALHGKSKVKMAFLPVLQHLLPAERPNGQLQRCYPATRNISVQYITVLVAYLTPFWGLLQPFWVI
jgi:hypothetical protein